MSFSTMAVTDVFWPCHKKVDPNEQEVEAQFYQLASLQGGVKEATKSFYQTGSSDETLYVESWKSIQKDLLPGLPGPTLQLWGSSKMDFPTSKNTPNARNG